MKCFFHPEADAVGICSHCHRAVCSKHKDCAHYESHHLFCKQHNHRTLSLMFTQYYMEAIDLARSAGMKGVKTSDVVLELQQRIDSEAQ